MYQIYDDYATIEISGGKFKGTIIYIDLEDVEKCKELQWTAQLVKRSGKIYILNVTNKLMLHRFLMDAPDGFEIDHRDADTLNNRKGNLRICKPAQNHKNKKLVKGNRSGHRGVYWDYHIKNPRWKAYIMVDYKQLHLGYFDTFEQAKDARLRAEKRYFKDYNHYQDGS